MNGNIVAELDHTDSEASKGDLFVTGSGLGEDLTWTLKGLHNQAHDKVEKETERR